MSSSSNPNKMGSIGDIHRSILSDASLQRYRQLPKTLANTFGLLALDVESKKQGINTDNYSVSSDIILGITLAETLSDDTSTTTGFNRVFKKYIAKSKPNLVLTPPYLAKILEVLYRYSSRIKEYQHYTPILEEEEGLMKLKSIWNEPGEVVNKIESTEKIYKRILQEDLTPLGLLTNSIIKYHREVYAPRKKEEKLFSNFVSTIESFNIKDFSEILHGEDDLSMQEIIKNVGFPFDITASDNAELKLNNRILEKGVFRHPDYKKVKSLQTDEDLNHIKAYIQIDSAVVGMICGLNEILLGSNRYSLFTHDPILSEVFGQL